jgi:hypothetical protein
MAQLGLWGVMIRGDFRAAATTLTMIETKDPKTTTTVFEDSAQRSFFYSRKPTRFRVRRR